MILYLDTSSLVKLYLDEEHSDRVREWVEESFRIATSRIAYVEALSAFARRHSEGDLSNESFAVVRQDLRRDWLDFVVVDLDEEQAGGFAIRYLLRGFDAVHLAAASRLHDLISQDTPILFSCFDDKLSSAARQEGLLPLPIG